MTTSFEDFDSLNRQLDEATSFTLEEMQLLSREQEYEEYHESDSFEYGMMEYQDWLWREGY